MSMKTTSANKAFLPDEAHKLIVQPVLATSIATQICEFAAISSTTYRIPIVTADPQAEWTAEGEEITPSDATLAEEVVTPKKLAGLTIISRELAEDSSPSAASAVGRGLARDIARKLDAAFFGTSTGASMPEGLEDLVGINEIDAGAAYDSLDAVLQAIADAETTGAVLTALATDPVTALTFAKLRETSSSIKTLLHDKMAGVGLPTPKSGEGDQPLPPASTHYSHAIIVAVAAVILYARNGNTCPAINGYVADIASRSSIVTVPSVKATKARGLGLSTLEPGMTS